jgi:hypothetical protein
MKIFPNILDYHKNKVPGVHIQKLDEASQFQRDDGQRRFASSEGCEFLVVDRKGFAVVVRK